MSADNLDQVFNIHIFIYVLSFQNDETINNLMLHPGSGLLLNQGEMSDSLATYSVIMSCSTLKRVFQKVKENIVLGKRSH